MRENGVDYQNGVDYIDYKYILMLEPETGLKLTSGQYWVFLEEVF